MVKNYAALLFLITSQLFAQSGGHSVAREWNEVLLTGIRGDFARPTVHARNLFHSSVLMYDAWAVFDNTAQTVFLGKEFQDYLCDFEGIDDPTDAEEATVQILSHGMYRLLIHRFEGSPGYDNLLQSAQALMLDLGLDPSFEQTDYTSGSYPALGNYLAEQLISFGLQDGANEFNAYENRFYTPVNDPLILQNQEEVYELQDPNRWQPLAFDVFVDQSGNEFANNIPEFLSPEWGEVLPFALKAADLEILDNGFESYVYNDPGAPPNIQNSGSNGIEDPYKWNFAMVAAWSAHLDPSDPTLIDISPGAIGNVSPEQYPSTFEEYTAFYDFENGGDIGNGHDLNPFTGNPYTPQMVKRADYARVLAEFWADGPDSETPPGHWFTILNYVSDHPDLQKRLEGQGEVVSDLEWDVKAYLALGGAMHDAAVTTWGIKGYYDYIRPISALRYMARGQSTDPGLPSFDPHGLPLIPGLIELIEAGDPLAGAGNENLGRLKVFAWRGPDFIADPELDVAGVGWILATQWWPYQRPSFVTPPFAGYVSGHSTFSSAAAEVLTRFTGDAFFPGGMGVFDVTQNEFLVFEEGPTESFSLQWATYRDASDQTSLSRIWGGIHPPVDDIPGRKLGLSIGNEAFELAKQYFSGQESVPADNFLVRVIGESCLGQGNGSVVVEAQEFRNYSLRYEGQELSFTESIQLENLPAATYSICIGIDSNADFERCFDVVVPEGQTFSATSTESADGLSLRVDIYSGTPPFKVKLDGQLILETREQFFNLPRPSEGILEIESSVPCEGSISTTLQPFGKSFVFPNPVESRTTVYIPDSDGNWHCDLFDSLGRKVFTQQLQVQNHALELDLEELPSGLYYLKIRGQNRESLRILKQ